MLADDTMLEAFFSWDREEQFEPTRAQGKRQCSRHTSQTTVVGRNKKRECKKENKDSTRKRINILSLLY